MFSFKHKSPQKREKRFYLKRENRYFFATCVPNGSSLRYRHPGREIIVPAPDRITIVALVGVGRGAAKGSTSDLGGGGLKTN